jgi:type III secretion protein V
VGSLAASINRAFARSSDLVLFGAVALALATVVIPVPPAMMDWLIAANMSVSLLLLFLSMGINKPSQLTSFPTLILLTTLFRLALNISTTRLILLEANAGEIIDGFGNLIVRGNFVVGTVVFLVVTLIQLIVITKGTERVSEVSARFGVDAVPGKQMAIDNDLAQGRIKQPEAQARREELERESTMFGAMEGATKFVKGDAIAGLVIVAVNIVGGLLVGVTQMGMTAGEAARTFAILTIGDGLVSQLPALMISLAAALVVTRVADPSGAPGISKGAAFDIIREVLAQPRAMLAGAGALLLLGVANVVLDLLPPLPFFGLALAAGVLGFVGLRLKRDEHRREREVLAARDTAALGTSVASPPTARTAPEPKRLPIVIRFHTDSLRAILQPDQPEAAKAVQDMLQQVRRKVSMATGFQYPPIQCTRAEGSGFRPPECGFVITLGTTAIWNGGLPRAMVMSGARCTLLPMARLQAAGIEAQTAVLAGLWIPVAIFAKEQDAAVRGLGVETYGPEQLFQDAMLDALRRSAGDIFGVQEASVMVEELREFAPDLVEAVIPQMFALHEVAEVMCRLLREDVPVADVRLILEGLARWRGKHKDPIEVANFVRVHLRRVICAKLSVASPAGPVIRYFTMDRDLERAIEDHVVMTDHGLVVGLGDSDLGLLRKGMQSANERAMRLGVPRVIVTDGAIRSQVRAALEEYPEFAVLSRRELAPGYRAERVGEVGGVLAAAAQPVAGASSAS